MESWPVSPPSCFVPERDPPLPPAFLFSRVALKRDIGRMDSSSSIVFDSDYLFLTWKRIVEEEELYVELFETFEKYIYIYIFHYSHSLESDALPRKGRSSDGNGSFHLSWRHSIALDVSFISPFFPIKKKASVII